jgi:oligopeptide/dipeptide ABC transporter ATP-binding protein
MNSNIILEIKGLKMYFPAPAKDYLHKKTGAIRAVDNVSLKAHRAKTLGLCGESGCGKSTLAHCIDRLQIPTSGAIEFEGVDITHLAESELRKIRSKISLVFQDPYSSLDPRQKIRNIVIEPIKVLRLFQSDRDEDIAHRLLHRVGLDPQHANRYPHELSGGQRQRVGIARALASDPKLVILDEPISSLDASIQAQIIHLLRELQDQRKDLTYIFISHDLSAIQYMSDYVAIMHLGRIVEMAETKEIFQNPLHPYTQMLLSAASMDENPLKHEPAARRSTREPEMISEQLAGCDFMARCHDAIPECGKYMPRIREILPGHEVACIKSG